MMISDLPVKFYEEFLPPASQENGRSLSSITSKVILCCRRLFYVIFNRQYGCFWPDNIQLFKKFQKHDFSSTQHGEADKIAEVFHRFQLSEQEIDVFSTHLIESKTPAELVLKVVEELSDEFATSKIDCMSKMSPYAGRRDVNFYSFCYHIDSILQDRNNRADSVILEKVPKDITEHQAEVLLDLILSKFPSLIKPLFLALATTDNAIKLFETYGHHFRLESEELDSYSKFTEELIEHKARKEIVFKYFDYCDEEQRYTFLKKMSKDPFYSTDREVKKHLFFYTIEVGSKPSNQSFLELLALVPKDIDEEETEYLLSAIIPKDDSLLVPFFFYLSLLLEGKKMVDLFSPNLFPQEDMENSPVARFLKGVGEWKDLKFPAHLLAKTSSNEIPQYSAHSFLPQLKKLLPKHMKMKINELAINPLFMKLGTSNSPQFKRSMSLNDKHYLEASNRSLSPDSVNRYRDSLVTFHDSMKIGSATESIKKIENSIAAYKELNDEQFIQLLEPIPGGLKHHEVFGLLNVIKERNDALLVPFFYKLSLKTDNQTLINHFECYLNPENEVANSPISRFLDRLAKQKKNNTSNTNANSLPSTPRDMLRSLQNSLSQRLQDQITHLRAMRASSYVEEQFTKVQSKTKD